MNPARRFVIPALALGLGLLAVGVVRSSHATAPASAAPKAKAEPLISVGPLAVGPGGVLFAADSAGAAVVAFEVGDGAPAAADAPFADLDDLDLKVAALLGTSASELVIQDLVVQPASKHVFLSLMRGRGEGARPVILRLAPDGKIAELPLETLPSTRLSLANAPAKDAKLWRFESRSLTVTDLELVDGELWIAGLSNEEFASTLRRAPYPFTGTAATTGLEIYHGAHGKWETAAPIFAFIPYEGPSGKQLLASYLCTPLVAFSRDEVRASQRLRGKTLAELGWGNVPIDMVVIEREGEKYLLMANDARGTMKLKLRDIDAALARPGLAERADAQAGVPYLNSPLGSVVQLADLDAKNVLLLSRDLKTGSLSLAPRPKEWI